VALGALFLGLPLITDGFGKRFDIAAHKRLVDEWRPERYPSVDVFLPVCGEPHAVLRNTWTHVAQMARHYRGTVVPYVLDDSANSEIRAMAREFGFTYATRPNRGWYKKSGNLWFGFRISGGDCILLLDADFAPRQDLLDETLPYMCACPDVGIVQTPQFFRVVDEQTWVERGAGAVQELFYRSIQTIRSAKEGAICVGSCAVYRRAALADNGGMTLAEHSEDMLTGFDLSTHGWKVRYLPIALSTGNCPDNVIAFLNQQYRWCAGTVSLLFTGRFWRTTLPVRARLCYLAGLVYYVYTAIFTFAVPALTISLLLFEPQMLLMRNTVMLLPAVTYAGIIFPAWHRSPYRLEAWSVRLVAGWAHVFSYFDTIRGKPLGWKPTGSDGRKQDGRRRFWACFLAWSVGSSLLWSGLALWRMMTLDPFNFVVMLGLGLFELLVACRVLVQPSKEPGHASKEPGQA
jgi:cellulose synthase (UDP-forming)